MSIIFFIFGFKKKKTAMKYRKGYPNSKSVQTTPRIYFTII